MVDAPFPPDDRSQGYERGSGISKEWQQATTFAAIEVANHVIGNLRTIARLKRDEVGDPGKLREFCHHQTMFE